MFVDDLPIFRVLAIEPARDRIEFVAERYQVTLERRESPVVSVEPAFHGSEACVHLPLRGSETRIHLSLQAREPSIHPLHELSNRHAKAANHSIVMMRR